MNPKNTLKITITPLSKELQARMVSGLSGWGIAQQRLEVALSTLRS
jgi:hypothetical protein